MIKNFSIQLKAAFLLIIFGLNTVVSIACAMDINMGFNSFDHHELENLSTHDHTEGVKLEHHKHGIKPEKDDSHHSKKEKKGCCNNDVQKFQSLDKALNQNVKTVLFAPNLVVTYNYYSGVENYKLLKSFLQKFKDRFFYPPPIDIRIAIRSFQI